MVQVFENVSKFGNNAQMWAFSSAGTHHYRLFKCFF